MILRYDIILISFFITLILQNRQGDYKGSIFLKINEYKCIHLHHWIISILIILFIYYIFKNWDSKNAINLLIGYGLAGFLGYSDSLYIYKNCKID